MFKWLQMVVLVSCSEVWNCSVEHGWNLPFFFSFSFEVCRWVFHFSLQTVPLTRLQRKCTLNRYDFTCYWYLNYWFPKCLPGARIGCIDNKVYSCVIFILLVTNQQEYSTAREIGFNQRWGFSRTLQDSPDSSRIDRNWLRLAQILSSFADWISDVRFDWHQFFCVFACCCCCCYWISIGLPLYQSEFLQQ